MRREFVIGAAPGATWAVIATVTHLAMFRGFLPAPAESSFAVAVLLYLLRAPFIAAIYLSTVIGRNSSTLVELVVEALIFGVIAGVTVAAMLKRPRPPAKSVSASPIPPS